MTVNEVATATALVALVVAVATVAMVVGLAIGPRVDAVERIVWWVRDHAFAITTVVAAGAMLGSLYYSEIADFEPCRYCWFQRIAMYPIVIVAAVAWWRRDDDARFSIGLLAGIGFLISSWHWLVQHNPDWAAESSCSATAPCTSIYVERFDFVTIPAMAASGFAAILVLMAARALLREDPVR